MQRLATFGFLLLTLLGVTAAAPQPQAKTSIVLWAWERPEDLSYAAAGSEIAFVAATIRLSGDKALLRYRSQALRLPPDATLIAVIHVDFERNLALDDKQRTAFVDAVLRGLANLEPTMVQIDYEAPPSQQAFYAATLKDLRARLPAKMRLSITALASWCMYENWTAALPIDEIVPMLFRMGRGSAAEYRIDGGGDFRQPNCRTALGVSTDEKRRHLPSGRRVYVFNPHSWNAQSYAAVLQEALSWN